MPFKNKEEEKAWKKEYRSRPEVKAARRLLYKKYRKNPEIVEKQREANRVSSRRPSALEARRARYVSDRSDPEKVKAHRRRVSNWYERNKQKIISWNVAYRRERARNDPWWRVRIRLSSRVWCAIARKYGKKSLKTEQLLGCTVAEFCAYFEAKFTIGMSWEKFLAGEIHIDHIKPCVTFDLTNEDQQKQCFHFSNLQPLWATENLKKGSKYAVV